MLYRFLWLALGLVLRDSCANEDNQGGKHHNQFVYGHRIFSINRVSFNRVSLFWPRKRHHSTPVLLIRGTLKRFSSGALPSVYLQASTAQIANLWLSATFPARRNRPYGPFPISQHPSKVVNISTLDNVNNSEQNSARYPDDKFSVWIGRRSTA